ncbi:MAG: hypothetical protein R2724_34970 [Bryobacterales bacterium]
MTWLWLTWLGCPKPPDDGLAQQLNLEVLALQEHLRQSQAELQLCQSGQQTDNPLYTELKKVLPPDHVDVEREGAVTRLVISASHLFGDPYKMSWRDEGNPTVSLLATALQLNGDTQVLVVGHSSDREIPRGYQKVYESNTDWSARMALALANRLSKEFELDPARFTIAGRGPYSPRDSNDVETGRDRNQRLEIWIYPADAPVPDPG